MIFCVLVRRATETTILCTITAHQTRYYGIFQVRSKPGMDQDTQLEAQPNLFIGWLLLHEEVQEGKELKCHEPAPRKSALQVGQQKKVHTSHEKEEKKPRH